MGNAESSRTQTEKFLEERQLDAFVMRERTTGFVEYVPRIKEVQQSTILKRRTNLSSFANKHELKKNAFSVSTASTVSHIHEVEEDVSPNELQIGKLFSDFGEFKHLDASIKHARKSEKSRFKKSKPTLHSCSVPSNGPANLPSSKVRKVINLTEEASKCGIYGIF